MRLVLISDTHAQHRKLTVPEGDVLIHAGDITQHGEASTLLDFNAWLGELPHKHKIVIAGNHDLSFDPDHRDGQMEPEEAIEALSNATYLCETSTVIYGIEFYGSPITPWFCAWGFNRFRGNEIKGHWDTIPETTDVLITHGPPRGILDQARLGVTEHLGCDDLLDAVNRVEPQLHVFGHIHGGGGQHSTDDTHFVNASMCDEAYRCCREPIVVEIFPIQKAPYEVYATLDASNSTAEVK